VLKKWEPLGRYGRLGMGSMYLPGCLHKRLDLLQIYHVRQCLFLVLFDYVLVSCSSIAGYLSVHYRIISYHI